MKKITLSICALALAATAMAQPLDRSIRPKAGPAPEIKLGKTESFTLPNGMRVFVVENHKLPALTVSIQLDVKPELESDMAGFQDMVGELVTSGTKTRTKDQFDAAVDAVGASIGASSTSVYGNSLKKHQGVLLELLGDMVLNADFKQTELDKMKTQALSGLEAAKNEPDAMLENVTNVINFGKNHPYGEVTTEETVNKITLERCKNYYSTYFRPNVAYMAIVGDVTMTEMKPLIEKYFGKWQKADVPVASYPAAPKPSGNRVGLAARDAAVQSVFNVTYPINLKPGEPDVIKAKVANDILGGGSNGRLFLNLREAHGWTYGSYSGIKQDDIVGSFTAYAKCRNAVTDSAITETIKEMKRMQTETVSDEDLKNHLASMTGNFASSLESPSTVAQYAINIERYKMPKDYYTNYLKNLNAVTAADVQMIAKKFITPENANIIVVGSEDMAKPLAKFGTVEMLDNYGRPAVKSTAVAVPAGVTATEVIKKYVAAIGGEKALNSIKDITTSYSAELQPGMSLTFVEKKKAGGKFLQTVEMMGAVQGKMAYNGAKGYSEQQGQKKDLEGDELADAKQQADIQSDLHPEKYAKEMTIKGIEKVDGNDAYVVEVTNTDGKKTKRFFDVSSGYLVRSISSEGEQVVTFDYSDYKEVPGANGYKLANVKKITGLAPIPIEGKLKTVEVNKNIPDTEFN